MGTFRFAEDFITYTFVGVTSESGQFVKENLLLREFPKRALRSTDTTQQDIDLNLGAVINDPEVHLEVCNFASVQFIGSNDGVAWTGYDSGTLTISEDKKQQGVYRKGVVLTGFSHQYLRVRIPAQTPTDGKSYFSLGTLSVMNGTLLAPQNPRLGVSYGVANRNGHLSNEFDSGGEEVYNLTTLKPLVVRLPFKPRFSGTGADLLWQLFRDRTKVVYVNFGLDEDWQAYLVRAVSDLEETRDRFSHTTFNTIDLKLIV